MKGANVTRRRREIRYILSFAILAGLLLIFLVWNICAGSVSISLEEITKSLHAAVDFTIGRIRLIMIAGGRRIR